MQIVAAGRKRGASPTARRWRHLVGIAAIASALAGCGAISTRHEGVLLPCGIGAEPVEASKDMARLDMSDSRSGLVRTLDGKPFCPQRRCDYATIVLPPGEHELIFSYLKSYSVLGPGGRDPVKLTFTARPGETYRAIVETTGIIGWRYNCRIEEAGTGHIVDEIDACDRDEIRRPAMQEVFDAYGGRDAYIEAECYR